MSRLSAAIAVIGSIPLAGMVWLAAAEPEESPARANTPAFQAEIDRLSSPNRAERIAAENALLERGPGLLDLLPNPADIDEPAARSAIGRIRKQLEKQRIEEAIVPTRVTIEGEGTFGELLVRLGQLVPYRLVPRGNEQLVEIQARDEPFWSVLDKLCSQAGIMPDRVERLTRSIEFRYWTADDDALSIAYAGPFRLVAEPVVTRPIAGNEERQLARTVVRLLSEPKLRPLFVSFTPSDFTLTPREGASLQAFTPDAKYEIPVPDPGAQVELPLDFVAAAGTLDEPLTLRGKATVTAAAGETWFSYDLVRGGDREQSRGSLAIRFQNPSVNPDGTAEIELTVVHDEGGPAFESHRTWLIHNAAYVNVADDGTSRTIQLGHKGTFETIAQADGGVVLRYRFSVPPDASSVVFNYLGPTQIVTVPLDVEIDGLTLTK